MACDLDAILRDANCIECSIPNVKQLAAAISLLCTLANGESPPFLYQVETGLIPGTSRLVIFGHNIDLDSASVPEDVWEGGGLYPFQSAAVALEILSTSAADAAAGTGARTVKIEGLTAAYTEQSEVVSLNGVGVVPLVNTYFRVNRCVCVTAGTGNTNAGVITLRVAGAGATQAVIDAGDGVAQQAVYTVPAGKTAFFIRREMGISRETAAVNVEAHVLVRRAAISEPWIVRNLVTLQSQGTSAYTKDLPFSPVLEKSDVRTAVVVCTANNVGIMCAFEGILVNN